MNKQEGMDIQHAFKKRNNKPGSKAIGPEEAKAIRTGKQIVKTQD